MFSHPATPELRSVDVMIPDWWQDMWPRRGPSTRSMLWGSPQWRQRMTRRSGGPGDPGSGGAILHITVLQL